MSKWGKYTKVHKKEWEKEPAFQGWLTENTSGAGTSNSSISSYCKLCSCPLRSHKGDLLKHATSLKHKSNLKKVDKNQSEIHNYGISVSSSNIKKKEIMLASYIAVHSSLLSIDHLADLINIFNSKPGTSVSPSDILHLHRTKCTAIIKSVIAPSLLQELITDIGKSRFSIIIDESTDTSNEKLLCICIKYYSLAKNTIFTRFLAYLKVDDTTAKSLFEATLNFFNFIKLDVKQVIGIGTDGANNLCGRNNSFFTLCREYAKSDVILVKCICHSLHLCTSKASEVFNDSIEFLLRETFNWFSHGPLRMSKYRDIYNLINSNNNLPMTKLVQLSGTRWLSRYKAIKKILSQYLELQTFFSISALNEKCFTATQLCQIYKSIETKLTLTFLEPILQEIYSLNLYFQSMSIDFYQSFNDINNLIWALAGRVLKPSIIAHLDNNFELLTNSLKFDQNYLNLNDCDLGYMFKKELQSSEMLPEQKSELMQKCVNFIKILSLELIRRMPPHLDILNKIKLFSPSSILNHIRPNFAELPLQFAGNLNINKMEPQYRNLLQINWKEVFCDNIPDDAITFWQKVIALKNAAGDLLFEDISLLAFTMLSTPVSNATVERMFSIMNVIKCKIRNRIMLELLNAIVFTKDYCNTFNICCKTFSPTLDMLNRFNSSMYTSCSAENVVSEENEVLNMCEQYM